MTTKNVQCILRNDMKFNSQIATTVEQSKKLLELGLNPDTSDMHHLAKIYWGDNWLS